MDVHRSRFVPYPTSAISALAFSRPSDNGYSGFVPDLKLAIGRANGSIEIWNPLKGLWAQETIFPGDNRSIDGLVWTHDPDDKDSAGQVVVGQHRLFSIASSPAVTEWNLATGELQRRSTGNFSEVWCFAVQPRWKPQKVEEESQSQDIIAGCGDGTLVLLSTADNDLQFKRNLARVSGKKARCMCVTYQNRDIIAAGFADSMIRIYDTRNGSQIRQLSLGVGIPGAPKTGLVWQVKSFPNGDLVSGDSNGELRVWDGRNYSLMQRITGHETDCLDLITSSDGKTVFSGSLDGRLAVYRQSNIDGARKSWAKHSHRRLHQGEVKAMTAFDSKGMSVVVSGGSDVTPMLTPLREYGKENVRPLTSLPQDSRVASASKARLLVSWWDKEVHVWRLARQASTESSPEHAKPRKLVAKMTLDTVDSIRSASISTDGRLLAASTSTQIKVFQLRKRAGSEHLAIRKIDLPQEYADLGARLLAFSPDGKWLTAVTPDNEVHVGRIAEDPTSPKLMLLLSKTAELERRHRKPTRQTGYKSYDRTIVRVAFAADSSALATGDLIGYIDSWVLKGHEDITAPAIDLAKHDSDDDTSNAGTNSDSDSSEDDDDDIPVFYGQHWAENPSGHLMPKVDSAPLVMTFRPAPPRANASSGVNGNPGIHATRHNPHAHSHALPSGQHRLFVMTARHQIHEFDLLDGRLSEWSRKNPTAGLPAEFAQINDRAIDAVWDVTRTRERLWLYGNSWVFMVNVGADLGNADSGDADTRKTASKRRRPRGEMTRDDVRKRRKAASGAGGKVDADERNGAGDVVKRYHDGQSTDIALGRAADGEQDDDEDDEDDDFGGVPLTVARSSGDEQETAVQVRDGGQRKWWLTFKYRPILGMVLLNDDLALDDEDRPLEVVIVERPLWEVSK